MILIAIAAALQAGAIDRAKPISIEIAGRPLAGILTEVSKQAGVRLEANGAVGRQVFAVMLNKAPLGETMDKLEITAGGQWTKTSEGGYVLVRTDELERKFAEAALDVRAEGLKSGLDEIQKRAGALAPWTDAMAKSVASRWNNISPATLGDREINEKIRDIQKMGPVGRLSTRLSGLFDPRELASFEPWVKQVYASTPNAVQRPLPVGAQEAIQQFAAEQSSIESLLSADQPAEPYSGRTYQPKGLAGRGTPNVLIEATPQPLGMGIELQINVYDAQGWSFGSAHENLSERSFEKTLTQAPKNEQPVELPATTRDLVDLLAATFKGTKPPGPTKGVLLTDIDAEPLSLMPGVALVGYARQQGSNLIARLQDADFMRGFMAGMSGQGWFGKTYLSLYTSQAGCEVQNPEGWILLRPVDPAAADRDSEDRSDLTGLLGAARENGRIDLETLGAYYSKTESRFPESIGLLGLGLLLGDLDEITRSIANIDLLRFYGSLTARQRESLFGGGLRKADLTDYQLYILSRLVRGPFVYLNSGPPVPVDPNSPHQFKQPPDIEREVTEALPNGFGGQLLIKATDKRQNTFIVSLEGSTRESALDSEGALAGVLSFPQPSGVAPTLHQLRISESRVIAFDINLTDEAQIQSGGMQLREEVRIPGLYRTIDELPEALRNRLKTMIDRNLKSYSSMPPQPRPSPPPE